jgi:hypothetical protein
MEGVVTNLDDSSEASATCTAWAYAVFNFEDAYKEHNGFYPMRANMP